MNNFSHGPVDVTSGIFYRPKDSKKTLLKSILKNILRQLNVSYKDSCCGDNFCGTTDCESAIVPVVAPTHTLSLNGGSAPANVISQYLTKQTTDTLYYQVDVSLLNIAFNGLVEFNAGVIPNYILTSQTASMRDIDDLSSDIKTFNFLGAALFLNNQTGPNKTLGGTILLTYTKI